MVRKRQCRRAVYQRRDIPPCPHSDVVDVDRPSGKVGWAVADIPDDDMEGRRMRTGRNGRSHALAGGVVIPSHPRTLPRRMQDRTCLLARSQNRAMAGADGRHLLPALETRWHSWQHLADSNAHVCNWGRRETRSRAALPPRHLIMARLRLRHGVRHLAGTMGAR